MHHPRRDRFLLCGCGTQIHPTLSRRGLSDRRYRIYQVGTKYTTAYFKAARAATAVSPAPRVVYYAPGTEVGAVHLSNRRHRQWNSFRQLTQAAMTLGAIV